jgi:signal transduction histidine kinase
MFLVDTVLAAGLFGAALVLRDPEVSGGMALTSPVMVAISFATCAVLVVRRSAPRLVLVATTGGACVATVLVGSTSALFLATLVALYTVAVSSERLTTWIAWAATAAAGTVAIVLAAPAAPSWSALANAVPVLPWTSVAAAVGDALRNRREYVAAIEERADRAERTRDEEARRRVAEERLRIARDLHDVVAHRIAVVNVQAGVASHLLDTRPDEAREALGHIRVASGAVLDELSDILSVLRQPGEPVSSTTPTPGLGQLDALVASFAKAGLAVNCSITGKPRHVAATVDLVAYRVVEEALTNAHKHGAGTAHLSLVWQPSGLDLNVTNPTRDPGGAVDASLVISGHGLVGMRERALAVGGVVRADHTPGLFKVDVQLPVPVATA